MLRLKPDVKLWKHQELARDWMTNKKRCILAARMRTGKTLAALAACEKLGPDLRVLVVTTQKGVQVWADEIEKFTTASYLALNGKESVRDKALKLSGSISDIVILNYDILWRSEIYEAITRYNHFHIIIMDESHRIKATNSKASKAAYKIGKEVKIKFALTGTLFPNSPMDIFGQARFIDDQSFGINMLSSFARFRAYYCDLFPVGPPGIYKVVGYKNMGDFNERLDGMTLKISDDVLDMPDQVFTDVPVALPKKVWDMYKQLNRESLLELESGDTLTVDNILVKTVRLAQIAGGFLAGQYIHDEKIKVVEELIESMPNEPFIIFCRFTDEINALYNRLHIKLGYSVARLTGKHNTLADFQSLDANIILVQIDAGAEAISLVQSGYVINYSVGYSLGKFEQAMARPRGAGQTRDKIFYYNLIAKGTVDEAIYKAIRSKSDIRDEVFAQIRSIG